MRKQLLLMMAGITSVNPALSATAFAANLNATATGAGTPVISAPSPGDGEDPLADRVIYEVYIKSFRDGARRDGVGDLEGVISKLDYLKSIGVNTVWITPFYESPMVDNGYDISNYRRIAPQFGDMETFDRLVQELHNRGMKLLMDMVVNHTSDQHRWFQESRKSKDNPYRDFYIWRDGRGEGKPPNNWKSFFGGSAWTYDERTGQWYLHLFSEHQPDLNWANPEVRRHIYEMMNWWLDKGVDGFRMDAIQHIGKSQSYEDADYKGAASQATWVPQYINNPLTFVYLREMYQRVFARHPDAMVLLETAAGGTDIAAKYKATMPDNPVGSITFEHLTADLKDGNLFTQSPDRWDYDKFFDTLSHWATSSVGSNFIAYIESHDQPRIVSRLGADYSSETRRRAATAVDTMMYMLGRGPVLIYEGQELGMTNPDFLSIEDYPDVASQNYYREQVAKGRDPSEVMEEIRNGARDNARTPIPYSYGQYGDFSEVKPWMRLNPNYRRGVNASAEQSDPNSALNYLRKVIRYRQNTPAVMHGSFQRLEQSGEGVFAYVREYEGRRIMVEVNLTDSPKPVDLPRQDRRGRLILDNVTSRHGEPGDELKPFEARVYELR